MQKNIRKISARYRQYAQYHVSTPVNSNIDSNRTRSNYWRKRSVVFVFADLDLTMNYYTHIKLLLFKLQEQLLLQPKAA